MTAARRVLLAVGLLVVAAMGIYPPWERVQLTARTPRSARVHAPAGYHPIFAPPLGRPLPRDFQEWNSGKFDQGRADLYYRDRANASVFVHRQIAGRGLDSASEVRRYDDSLFAAERERMATAERLRPTWIVKIDFALLGMQWLIVVALVGAAMLMPWPRRGR